jgi:hypothetical protein
VKFKAGNYKFKAPPFGMIESAVWRNGVETWRMAFVGFGLMAEMRAKNPDATGIPVYYAFDGGVGYVHPAPDRDGEMKLRYFPHVVEV